MKVTKLEHSGLMVEENGRTLLCDPVEFTEKLPEFANVVAVVITHKHGDHLQPAVIERIRATNPGVQILVPEDAAEMLPGATVVRGGERRGVEGFDLQFFGKDHAAIMAGQVPCQNVGVVINGAVANPGDSFDVPGDSRGVSDGSLVAPSGSAVASSDSSVAPSDSSVAPSVAVKLLLVPISAPWAKVSEAVDYALAVKPEVVLPVHDAVLSELGKGYSNNWLKTQCEKAGIGFVGLRAGESVEI